MLRSESERKEIGRSEEVREIRKESEGGRETGNAGKMDEEGKAKEDKGNGRSGSQIWRKRRKGR